MPLQPVNADQCWEVEIHWAKPLAYTHLLDAGCNHDDSAQLYHILACYAAQPYKSLYIGHTYDQCVSVRLAQPDHTHRYTDFVKDYPRHSFWVSCGIITMSNGKRTRKRVQDIETLLIHTNRSEHLYNVRNVSAHSVTDAYRIHNYGCRYDLPRELHLGLFVR